MDLMSNDNKQLVLNRLLDGEAKVVKDFTCGRNKVGYKTARDILKEWTEAGIVTKLENENCIGREGLFKLNPAGLINFLNCQQSGTLVK